MKYAVNMSINDRLLRILIAEILVIISFFWLWGIGQTFVFIVSFLIFSTGVYGYCIAYKKLGKEQIKKEKRISKIGVFIFLVVFVIVAIFGPYYSIFFTKKIFLGDYNKMNNYYKQTLFFTGKENREESINNYVLLIPEYQKFLEKYTRYHPYSLKEDMGLNNDLVDISQILAGLREEIQTGNLKNSHLTLETVRPIFQDILKRNNFSMLAVALVDFHDVMEKVIDAANEKDIPGLMLAYNEADTKLKAVEEEENDAEITAIRLSLDELKNMAENGETEKLADKANELKSNFVKVYLKRG